MLVAKHLNLDMARIDDEFLDEDTVVAEGGFRLGARAGEALRDLFARMSDPHALAAAASGGLDHHRIADLVGDLSRAFRRFDHAEMAGNGRDLGRIGEFLRFDLVAHRLDGFGIGADEDDLRFRERMRERRALGKKAVTRMDRLGARLETGGDDLVDREIGRRGRGRADGDRLVRHFDVERVLIGFGIDRDGPDAHPARRPDDATGDFAAVGDQDRLKHRPLVRESAKLSLKSRFYWNDGSA